MAILLRNLTPGTCVYLDETVNNVKTRVPYIYLGLDYNKNCILLRQYAVVNMNMSNVGSQTNVYYGNTGVHAWLKDIENGFLSRFDKNLINKTCITRVVCYSRNNSSDAGVINIQYTNCFILSAFEYSLSGNNTDDSSQSVSYLEALKTFTGTTDTYTARITYNENAQAVSIWTRTASRSTFGSYYYVPANGAQGQRTSGSSDCWIRPAISFKNYIYAVEVGTDQYYIESNYFLGTVGDLMLGTTIYIPEKVSGNITSVPYFYLGTNDVDDHILMRRNCLAEQRYINSEYKTNYEDTEIDQWLEDTSEGFLSRFREPIISFLKDTVIRYSDTNQILEINRKCFLPSCSEVGYGDLPTGNEGSSFLEAMKMAIGTNIDTSARAATIDGGGSSAYWLRSAADNQRYYVASSNTSPASAYTNSIGSARVRPMLSIMDSTPIEMHTDINNNTYIYFHSSISAYPLEEVDDGAEVFIQEKRSSTSTENIRYIYIGKSTTDANLFIRATVESSTQILDSREKCSYEASSLSAWLESTNNGFLSRFAPNIINVLVNVPIKCVDYYSLGQATGQVVEINRKCFLPSASELGLLEDPAGNDGVSIIQSFKKYYNTQSASVSCYINNATSGTMTSNYWTRSMRTGTYGESRFLLANGNKVAPYSTGYYVRPILAFSPRITVSVRGNNRSDLYINTDIESINTVDIVGDFLTGSMLIDRMITEFTDDVITTVGTGAFAFCDELNKVELPFVETISSLAFYNCYGLESIVIGTDLDTVCELENADAFYNTSQDLKIYVPDDLVDSYKEATNWTEHATKIAGISERPR